MNEELQKELLSILRAMKDGAPHAWQTLVEQRSTYCLTLGIVCLLIAAAGVFAVLRGLRMCRKAAEVPTEYINYSSIKEMTTAATFQMISGIVIGVAGLISVGIGAGEGINNLAEGLAPLGRVLEALR